MSKLLVNAFQYYFVFRHADIAKICAPHYFI